MFQYVFAEISKGENTEFQFWMQMLRYVGKTSTVFKDERARKF